MRVAIIGQQDFGKAVMEAFLARGDTVAGVFVAPEKPGGKPDPMRVAAEPFMPMVGPPEGWRMAAEDRSPRRARPCTKPMVVVDLPSPRGVGVMAVTSTYLPLGRSARRFSTSCCSILPM